MDSIIRTIVEKLSQRHPGDDVTATSDCIEELFKALGHEDVGDVIADAVAQGTCTAAQGQWFLGVAIWSGETNGGDLAPTLERWLVEAKDSLCIGLSLAQPTFPFRSRAEMERVLTQVAIRFPEHVERCRELISNRKAQDV